LQGCKLGKLPHTIEVTGNKRLGKVEGIPPARVTRPCKAHDLPLKNADNAHNTVNAVQLRG